MQYLLVFIGGGLGAMLRHFVNGVSVRLVGTDWPLGTLFINVTGSILMGVVAAMFAFKLSLPPSLRLFLATGILGGYTTFSTFALDAVRLAHAHRVGLAFAYVGATLVVAAAAVGIATAGTHRALSRRAGR